MDDKKVDLNEVRKHYAIESWNFTDIDKIHDHLEKPHWAPWLCFSKEGMAQMVGVFSAGQIVVKHKETDLPVAYISSNRVNWSGDAKHLPTWDDVAGNQVALASYHNTYVADGNTLVIMCLTVGSQHQGKFLSALLIDEIKKIARHLKITHIVSPFRPSTYGQYKREHGHHIDLKKYCILTRPDGLPVDAWFRNLVRNGMIPLEVRADSIVVSVPIDVFTYYKLTYYPDRWKQIATDVWECQEAGQWFVGKKKAIYREAEMWGQIPIY